MEVMLTIRIGADNCRWQREQRRQLLHGDGVR